MRAPVSGHIGDRRVSPAIWLPAAPAAARRCSPPSFRPIRSVSSSLSTKRRICATCVSAATAPRTSPAAAARRRSRSSFSTREEFAHQGMMDFVDNVIERSSGTIRGRAVFKNDKSLLTPGMFARVQVPASEPYDALTVPDVAIGSEQVRKFVFVVDEQNTAQPRYVTLGPVVDGRRVIKDGLNDKDRVIVNGLMRVRPGSKVTPKEEAPATPQGPQAKTRSARAGMRISHFFIDRPIFAAVVSIVPRRPSAGYRYPSAIRRAVRECGSSRSGTSRSRRCGMRPPRGRCRKRETSAPRSAAG